MEPRIAVTSRSFSTNATLRDSLLREFPEAVFNDEGYRLEGDSLVDFLGHSAGAIIGIERFDDVVLSRLPHLRVLSKFGVGLDSIDLEKVGQRGIHLATTQGTNSSAVAELTLLLILGALRRIPEAISNVRSQKWISVTGNLLEGKTVGLIGVGNVGRKLNHLLHPFGCSIIGYDTSEKNIEHITFVSMRELLEASDVVCILVPLTELTRNMVGAKEIDLMKDGAVLINTSRGGVINEPALLAALVADKIAAAGLDVLENEPLVSWDLVNHPKVFATPHIAGTSFESNLAMGRAAIDGLIRNRERLLK